MSENKENLLEDEHLDSEIEEEVEDDSAGDEKEDHPFCTKDIKIISTGVSLDNIVKRLKHNEIDLSPSFQRREDLWTRKNMSRLIESILLRLPLPIFYFDVSDPEKWIVIDGLQRLSTIKRFMVDKNLKLGYLEFLSDLSGKGFDELDRKYQRTIEETQLMTYQVDPQTPKEVKYSIFNRINTGGLTLTPQEIRQALNQKGNAVNILEAMISTEAFKRTVNIRSKRMVANELALRFLAFTREDVEPQTSFEYNLPTFLDRTMEKIDLLDALHVNIYTERLSGVLLFIEKLIDIEIVFNKTLVYPENKKTLNRSLFDMWTSVIYRLDDTEKDKLLKNKDILRIKYKELLSKKEFDDAITKGSNDKKRIIERFRLFNEFIEGVLVCG